jgi:diacylglycerol O-acyltransferase / wax synthase
MRPLHPIDFIFLSLEKRQQPMHVGGLFLFQIPENAPASFIQNLVADIRNSKSIPIPPFNNGCLSKTMQKPKLHRFLS